MKRLIQILVFSLTIFLIGCEKESNDSKIIVVETGKSEYIVNSKIDVTIKNNLDKQANHFICDNTDLSPWKILKYENGTWVGKEYSFACTQMGPMGYFGVLDISESKHDTISLFNEIGKFRLRYRFVVNKDTLDFDSNEFQLNGLDL
jgi:hypothetical protein